MGGGGPPRGMRSWPTSGALGGVLGQPRAHSSPGLGCHHWIVRDLEHQQRERGASRLPNSCSAAARESKGPQGMDVEGPRACRQHRPRWLPCRPRHASTPETDNCASWQAGLVCDRSREC